MTEPKAADINPKVPVAEPSGGRGGALEENHRVAERAFWRSQLSIAKWMNIITGVAAFVGLVTLYFLNQSLGDSRLVAEATQAQAKAALQANEAQINALHISQRPWVSAEQAIV